MAIVGMAVGASVGSAAGVAGAQETISIARVVRMRNAFIFFISTMYF
jgi:hypothetical protein